MAWLLNIIYFLALLIYSPKIIYRMIAQNRYKQGWRQKLGKISRRSPNKPCIWIHAVSVGEVNATRTLIPALIKTLPDCEIVISTTTDTGFARAQALYAKEHSVFYYPADFSWIVKRAFKNIKPAICLLMELEVWPNFAVTAQKTNTPIVILNGRISEKSYPRYKLIKPVTKWMFSKVTTFLVQTNQYRQRFCALGTDPDKIIVTNSLKYDTAVIYDKAPGSDELAQQLNITTEPLFAAGGTGPGEEKIILDTFEKLKNHSELKNLRTAIIPRKPERFDAVAQLASQSSYDFVRYSTLKGTENKLDSKPDIIIGDTMGDLTKFYSLASVTFVGRSMVKMGGSDMMEPAALGKCIILGPHTFNFQQTVDALLENNSAIEVHNPHQLYQAALKCLTNTELANGYGQKARQVIKDNQGATQKSVEEIARILQYSQKQ
jgi:3-deoxy-D-manno-octulosonic-acid transferase